MKKNQLQEKLEALINDDSRTKEEVIAFNKELDDFFYVSIEDTEKTIDSPNKNVYTGTELEALLTPYCDYYQMICDIPKGECLVDLGAGYSRGTLLASFLELSPVLSLEINLSRVLAAQLALASINGKKEEIRNADIGSEILEAYGYYLYFPKGEVLYKILNQLFEISKRREVYLYVCESHGDVQEFLSISVQIEPVKEFTNSLPRHRDKIVKYRLSPLKEDESFNNDLFGWFLQNYQKDLIVTLNYRSPLDGEYYQWPIPIVRLELILYVGEVALYDNVYERVISFKTDGQILHVKKLESFSESVRLALFNKKYKKVLISDVVYVEEGSGRYFPLNT